MVRLPVIVALALALAPTQARCQVRVLIDGVAQDIPAGVVRTVTTRNGRTTVRDTPWTGGEAFPGAASITTTEETEEDDRGRVLSRVVTTRIEPQSVAYAQPVRVVVQQAAPPPQAAYAHPAPRIDIDPDVLDDTPPSGTTPRILRLKRDSLNGHFVAPVMINGVKLKAIIDTGAAYTILSADDARRSGADQMVEREEVAVGIGGYTRVGVVRLASVEIGGQSLGRITARIGQPGIPYTLLGQTEIARLGRVTIEDGVMTIHPRGVELASR